MHRCTYWVPIRGTFGRGRLPRRGDTDARPHIWYDKLCANSQEELKRRASGWSLNYHNMIAVSLLLKDGRMEQETL